MSSSAGGLPLGQGDAYTLAIAVAVFAIASLYHWRTIRVQGSGCGDTLSGIMSSALTVGPLLMILFDPLNKYARLLPIDLLDTVVHEARVTLWFAAFLALINTVINLCKSRD